MMRPDAPWADLPVRFDKPNSVGKRYRRRGAHGIGRRVFEAVQTPDLSQVMLDASILRIYQHAAGQKKAPPLPDAWAVAGGWSTKIHDRTVAQGRAVRLRATTGQAGDYLAAAAAAGGPEAG